MLLCQFYSRREVVHPMHGFLDHLHSIEHILLEYHSTCVLVGPAQHINTRKSCQLIILLLLQLNCITNNLIYMCCSQLCSHCGWLLLKCSAIGIGFNGAETNCRIAHILGILLMNSCNTDRFLATTVVCGLSTLN